MADNKAPNFLGMLWKTPTQSKWSKYYVANTRRPRKEEQGQSGVDTFAEWQLPPHPIAYRDMYNLAKLQVNTRTSIKHLVWELVRRGLEWKQKWTAKCKSCGHEYHSINHYLPCPECGGDMVAPDPKEYEWAEGKVHNCNANHQNLLAVIESISEDHHTVDEGYMVLRKEYAFDDKGNISMGHVKEILRGSPQLIRPVANPKTGMIGWNMFVCPIHRGKAVFDSAATNMNYSADNPSDSIQKCQEKECKCNLYPVHYVTLKCEGGEPEDYFIEGEIMNRHMYGTNILYGTPPMLTLWPIAAALFYQETYIRDAFERKRIPNGALLVNTSNATGFMKFWKNVVLEMKNDQHFIPVVPLETEPGATQQGRVNFVSFMNTLKEMEYIPTRDEFRQRIASFYGVSTMFMADTRQSGGGNISEGSQLVVSSRSIERIQKVWNEYYLPRLSSMLGVSNWVLQIKPTEDRDLLKDLQKEQLQLQNNQMYTTIGYTSEQDPYDGTWLHKKDFAQELQKTVEVAQTLVQFMSGVSGGMGMGGGMGGPQGGGGDGQMQSYEPNPQATQKGEDKKKEKPKSKEEEDLEWYDKMTAQIEEGTKHEMEHTNDENVARKIAMDHLREVPDYYDRLKVMELRAKLGKKEVEPSGKDVKKAKKSPIEYDFVPGGLDVHDIEVSSKRWNKNKNVQPVRYKEDTPEEDDVNRAKLITAPRRLDAFNSKYLTQGENMAKAKAPGTPQQGTTNMSSPKKMPMNPKGKTPVTGSDRTRDAPGMPHNYRCPYCGEQFNDKRALGGHMKSRHKGAKGDESGLSEQDIEMGSTAPDPASWENVLSIMQDSQMFDPNIMGVLENVLAGSYPEEEVAPKGDPGARASPSGFQRQRKYQ